MLQPNMIEFYDHLRTKGLAPRSCDEYVRWGRRLVRWCDQWSTTPAEATVACIATWSDTLPDTWSTRKNAATAIHHLLEWCERRDDAWRVIYVPRKPDDDPLALDAGDARLLHDTAVLMGGRPGLAVLLGLHLGARRSEIASMRWDGVDLEAGRIRYQRVKRGKRADLVLHPALAAALARHPRHGVHLFVGNNGRPHVHPNTVWAWVRKVADVAGIEGVWTHRLRHTLITEVYDRTKNIRAAQYVAGHRDIRETARYTRVRREQADEALLLVNYSA